MWLTVFAVSLEITSYGLLYRSLAIVIAAPDNDIAKLEAEVERADKMDFLSDVVSIAGLSAALIALTLWIFSINRRQIGTSIFVIILLLAYTAMLLFV